MMSGAMEVADATARAVVVAGFVLALVVIAVYVVAARNAEKRAGRARRKAWREREDRS